MGPKKKEGDGEDMSVEKFLAKYKKQCQAYGMKPWPQITEKHNEYLETGSNITKFNLWDEMGWQGVKALMDALRESDYQYAQSVRLWNSMCEDEGCRAVCRYIMMCPSVIVLELLSNRITALGCQFIGKMVNPHNTESKCNLTILKLDHNPIGSEGMGYLAEGLRQNKNIVNLSLTYCEIDEEGARSIFEVLLFQGSMLEEIDLGGNHLRNDGTIEVLKGASAAKNLKRLGLQDNQFMEQSSVLEAMHFCMKNNQTLGRYNFKYNFLGDDGVEHLCEIMKECNWVYDVEIPERISKATMEKYQEVKNANKPKKGKKGGKGKKKKK